MARQRMSRAEQRESTHEHLLTAAAEVFAQRGYAGASVQAIAEAAGFTIGALYSHFASKEDLFVELLDRRYEQLVLEIEAAIQASAPGGIARQIAAIGSDEEALLSIEFHLHAARNGELRDRLAAHHRKVRNAMAGIIQARREELGIEARWDDLTLATLFLSLVDGMGFQRRIDPEAIDVAMFQRLFDVVTFAASSQTQGE